MSKADFEFIWWTKPWTYFHASDDKQNLSNQQQKKPKIIKFDMIRFQTSQICLYLSI